MMEFVENKESRVSVGPRERLNQHKECDGSRLITHLTETDLQQVFRQEW